MQDFQSSEGDQRDAVSEALCHLDVGSFAAARSVPPASKGRPCANGRKARC